METDLHVDGRTTRHQARKGELLAAVSDHIETHGLAEPSVRELATAVGISHRTLLYHFGTKEQLVLAALEHIRERDQGRIREQLLGQPGGSPVDVLRAAWGLFSAPERMPYVRLLHQVLALGLDREPYTGWSRRVADERVAMLTFALVGQGSDPADARGLATLLVAAFRGLQLQLALTGDRAATDAAFETLLTLLAARLPRSAP